jgi:hypothetical protein
LESPRRVGVHQDQGGFVIFRLMMWELLNIESFSEKKNSVKLGHILHSGGKFLMNKI